MAAHIGMVAPNDPVPPRRRLDSWKEIATFFGRDERTVKRWEKERGLPVHRVPGSTRGGVFAYGDELDEWLQSKNESPGPIEVGALAGAAGTKSRNNESEPLENSPASEMVGNQSSTDSTSSTYSSAERIFQSQSGFPRSVVAAAKPFVWLFPLALIAGSFLVFSFGHREQRFRSALAAPHVPGVEAQDLYLKGRYYFEKRTPDDLNKAVDFFTQAIVHDPAYPAPYVGLADTYNLLREYSAMLPEEAFPRALSAAKRAVELDPTSAEAHNSLAFATFWGFFDAATAEREFKKAIELDPKLPRAHHWYATFLVEIGRSQDALAEIERARQLDPSSTPILADKGFILAEAGKKEEARSLLTQLISSQPDFVHPHSYLAESVYLPEGNYGGFLAEKRIVARLRHDTAADLELEKEQGAYEKGGVRGLLEAQRAFALQSFDRHSGSAVEVASAYATLGNNEEALKYLKIAYERHDLLLATLPLNISFRPLHQKQEFRELVAKVGLPPIN
jgi:tetratricopeptide (TPR) repeat protein